MGSPSSRLKTDEKYRPWVDAGLEYVFAPGHAQQVAQAAQQASAAPPMPKQAPPRPPQNFQQQSPRQTSTPQQAPTQSQAPAQQPMAKQSPPPRTAPPVQQQTPPQPPPAAPQAKVNFPEPWAGFLSRVKTQSPKVVCTYMELGLDLGGQPDPKRGQVLRNTLTHHLKWPTGTAAFWPVAALTDGTLQPNPSMFWKGWELWKSPYIVCFGEEALRVIYPEAVVGSSVCMMEHVQIHIAPPLSQLMGMLPHDQQLAIEPLLGIRF